MDPGSSTLLIGTVVVALLGMKYGVRVLQYLTGKYLQERPYVAPPPIPDKLPPLVDPIDKIRKSGLTPPRPKSHMSPYNMGDAASSNVVHKRVVDTTIEPVRDKMVVVEAEVYRVLEPYMSRISTLTQLGLMKAISKADELYINNAATLSETGRAQLKGCLAAYMAAFQLKLDKLKQEEYIKSVLPPRTESPSPPPAPVKPLVSDASIRNVLKEDRIDLDALLAKKESGDKSWMD